MTIRCASFWYSATNHSIPLLLSTKSNVCPYVQTISIRPTSFAMFMMAWSTWKFSHSKFWTWRVWWSGDQSSWQAEICLPWVGQSQTISCWPPCCDDFDLQCRVPNLCWQHPQHASYMWGVASQSDSPDNGSCYRWQILHLRHVVCFWGLVLSFELVVQMFDVLLYWVEKLSLVLMYSTTNLLHIYQQDKTHPSWLQHWPLAKQTRC